MIMVNAKMWIRLVLVVAVCVFATTWAMEGKVGAIPTGMVSGSTAPKILLSPVGGLTSKDGYCPSGGCDFLPGVVLIKLEPDVVVERHMVRGEEFSEADLNRVLREEMLRSEPVFPRAARPDPLSRGLRAGGVGTPMPDLTLWRRITVDAQARSDRGAEETDLDSTARVTALVHRLAATRGVAHAEPDFLRRPIGDFTGGGPGNLSPASARHRDSSGPGSGQDRQWHLDAINLPAARDYLRQRGLPPEGSSDVVVAVIDTGVDFTHPDLAASMWVNPEEFFGTPGLDDDENGFVDDIHGAVVVEGELSGNPMDDHGHGTHVAGIIAGKAGLDHPGGVAPNVRIMAVKAARSNGDMAASDIARGIIYAVDMGAEIINMSFGGYARSQLEYDALITASGPAVLVAAAGNHGLPGLSCPETLPNRADMYPAAYNFVLGVMAGERDAGPNGDYLAGFSNYDCISGDTRDYELMAPGVRIWSTLPFQEHGALSGTSMAAPVVSGIAALARTAWSDKSTYPARFIMGQVASSGPWRQGRTLPGETPMVFRFADALEALTSVPKPGLGYLEHRLFDSADIDPENNTNGIADVGETVHLAIVLRNHWSTAENVSVTLKAQAEGAAQLDPHVQMLVATVDYGVVGSFTTADNGLNRNEEGQATGVDRPFTFRILDTTPNNHLIPFVLTITADNALNPAQPALTSESRFFVQVRRARDLPRVVSTDMTLTSDYYWMVPDTVLIEPGATVTVSEGTRIQFFSGDPESSAASRAKPRILVEGRLRIEGTEDDPVELFPGPLHPDFPVVISQEGAGDVRIRHAVIANPVLGIEYDFYTGQAVSTAAPLTAIQSSVLAQQGGRIRKFDGAGGAQEWEALQHPIVNAVTIQGVRFSNLGYGLFPLEMRYDTLETSLFDAVYMDFLATKENRVGFDGTMQDSVFLKNHVVHFDGQESLFLPSRIDLFANLGTYANNAYLNQWNTGNPDQWLRFVMRDGRGTTASIANNYWGPAGTGQIAEAILDFSDDVSLGVVEYGPILAAAPETAYPFVVDAVVSTAAGPAREVGAGEATFTATFNRDMDATIQPLVSFGPDEPYREHLVSGDWTDARTWVGTYPVTPAIGDGYQYLRVTGAAAADDPWLITGNDAGRFRFEVRTAGTGAMRLEAVGGAGHVELAWTVDEFELLAGYNIYRAVEIDGDFERLNPAVIPRGLAAFQDTDIEPGKTRYYYLTLVRTDLSETGRSNTAAGTPLDDLPPEISHVPASFAPSGFPLSIRATVTDNVAVESVTLFHRAGGTGDYASRNMTRTTGDRYSATLEASLVVPPGIEYYIQAGDGVNIAQSGSPDTPHAVLVTDNAVPVTFDAQGGSTPVPANKMVAQGAPYGNLPTTTRADHIFVGWFTEPAEGTRVTPATTVTLTTAHTLYAQWMPEEQGLSTVTFDARGGTIPNPDSKIVQEGSTYGDLPATTRQGYVFTGWFTAETDGEEVKTTTTVTATENHTLYARWSAASFTVTFDAQGGSEPHPAGKSVTYDSPYGDLPTVTREGYTFAGWFTAAANGFPVTPATTVATASDHTLYAVWAVITYSLEVRSQGAANVPIVADPSAHSGTTTYVLADLPSGSEIILIAPASSEEKLFRTWTGCTEVYHSRVCIVTMDADKTVTAGFHPGRPVSLPGVLMLLLDEAEEGDPDPGE